MLRKGQPQNSSTYARFGCTDKTVNSYYSIAKATQAAQTTLPGRPSQVLKHNITQESQVALDRLRTGAFCEPH
jgi:hypothetical protein